MSIGKFREALAACASPEDVLGMYNGLTQAEMDEAWDRGWDPVNLDGSEAPPSDRYDGLLAWTASQVVTANGYTAESFAEISPRPPGDGYESDDA